MRIIAGAALWLAAFHAVNANKDSTYYNNGMTNPNTNQAMYWHEGYNVLEDLSQFDKLYVTYHYCAWETPTGDDEDGGDGGDGDDWYLGSVPSFRANVAYSLYGILKGEKDNGCNKKTFINSFHTTQGLESFTNSMAASGLTNLFELYDGEGGDEDDALDIVTSTCYADEDEGGDGDDNVANGQKMYGGSSYGLGCAADGSREFALHTYGGSYCDANAITGTLDELEDLNERLEMAKCVPIYEGGYYDPEEQDDEDVDPLDVLATSRACRIHDGTKSCPDPYGQLKKRERQLNKATGSRANPPFWDYQRVMIASWTMIAAGIFLTLSAIGWAVNDYVNDRTAGKPRQKTLHKDKDGVWSTAPKKSDPMKPSRNRSDLSEAISSVASSISKSLGITTGSQNSKKSKRSNKSGRSSKRSGKSGSSRRSKRSGGGGDKDGTPDTINVSPSYKTDSDSSTLGGDVDEDVVTNNNIKDADAGDGGDDDAAADAAFAAAAVGAAGIAATQVGGNNNSNEEASLAERSVQAAQAAVSDMVDFFKQASENFQDEPDDESVEMKIPEELNNKEENNDPSPPPSTRRLPSEAEVESNYTEKEDNVSKKKWRKRRWFRKLMGK